ncbi:hypothetical protein SCLCIDRAFT_70274, partial [Scleroderma citrinum Foug A]
ENEPGGTFTVGSFHNSSLCTGQIDFRNISVTPSHWLFTMSICTHQSSRKHPTGSSAYAAVDIGTTLVGRPSNAIWNVHAQILPSGPGAGGWEGCYSYSCDTAVNIAISFGSPSCPVGPADFHLTHLSSRCSLCFLRLQTGTNRAGSSEILSWCVSCLNSVYSVFTYNPHAIGFTQLSETVLAMNDVNGNPP